MLLANQQRATQQETTMATNESTTALAQDLGEAIDELHAALGRASDAAGRIQGLLPRVGAVNALLDEIESVIQAGRHGIGGRSGPQGAFTRPALVPTPETVRPSESEAAEDGPQPEQQGGPSTGELVCFRLEFQSSGGPLDLRAVDDAVGEHPAVRDVALLDYDGRTATLKVWIVPTVSPVEVQQSLSERAGQLFAGADEVTIIALEDAA
jgi:hypothetical protein